MGSKQRRKRSTKTRNKSCTQRRREKLAIKSKNVDNGVANNFEAKCGENVFAICEGNNEIIERVENVESDLEFSELTEIRSNSQLHGLDEDELVDFTIDQINEELTQSPVTLEVAMAPEDQGIIDSSESVSSYVNSCGDNDDFPNVINWDKVKNMGRRISDLPSWWQELHEKFAAHGKDPECRYLNSLKLDHFYNQALNTYIYISCKNCQFTARTALAGDKPGVMGVTEGAVCSSITSGSGYYGMVEQLAAIDIPSPSHVTYRIKRHELFKSFYEASEASMQKAGELKRKFAEENGQIVNGIPWIDVIADGAWGKRTYQHSEYNSLAGVGVIVGRGTKQVVDMDIRNKYCDICVKAELSGKGPRTHDCYKNWGRDQSSTSMEADIMVECFKRSIKTHGLIYKTLIADEDASTYQAIRDANPYGDYNVTVRKVNCCNHLFRNLCRKIKDAAKMKFTSPPEKGTLGIKAFRNLVQGSSLRMQRLIEKVRDIRKLETASNEEKVLLLQKDILAIVKYIFGDHSICGTLPVECEAEASDINYVPQFHRTGIYDAIIKAVMYLSAHAASLLEAETNNLVEPYNSVLNKYNEGKRVNHCARNSFYMRCYVAVVQYNSQAALSNIHVSNGVKVPAAVTKMEEDRQRHVENNRVHRQEKRQDKGRSGSRRGHGTDKDYGPLPRKPDLEKSVYDVLVDNQFEKMIERQNNRSQIERDTISQSNSDLWQQIRSDMITASRFGDICRMLPTTSCSAMVKNIRYPKILDTAAIQHGLASEKDAIQALQIKLGKKILPCGLFIDPEISYLGATPDGLIENDGIVEIKCPYSAKDMEPEVAIKELTNLKRIFDRKNPQLMNQSHKYFYQVQGQLRVTGRRYCIFALWTTKGIKHVTVLKDNQIWECRIKPQLTRFYLQCLLPEIVDSRRSRSMPIKKPDYILRAREELNLKKQSRERASLTLADDSGETCKRKKIQDSEDATDYPPKDQRHVTAPWVTIDVDDNMEPTDMGRQILETVRINISAEEVIADILPSTSLLNDTSIDLFQTVVHENSDFCFHPASYFAYHTFIQPCTSDKDMHIIGGNATRHWCCVFYDGSTIMIYDSMCRCDYVCMHEEEKRYLARRYPHVQIENIHLQPVTAQPDSHSCGIYAAAFATTIALGGNPTKVQYARDAKKMREHMVSVIESRKLFPFPTQ